MKMLKRIIITVLAVILVFALKPADRVFAEEIEKNFATLDENEEFIVCIEWENTRPVVKFISPSGEVYDTAVEQDNTMVSVGDKMLYYYIENAEAGNWKIVYDKLDNENIYVTLEGATSPFVVKDVKVNSVMENVADVSFEVEYDQDRTINYVVYVSANETSRGKEVAKGSCSTNELTQVAVKLDSVSSYSAYKVYVYAYFKENGVDIFDGAYSDPFAYVNTNQGDITTESYLVIKPNEYMAILNWEPKYGYTYIVSLFENGAEEPTSFKEISDTSVKLQEFAINPDTQEIEIRIAEKYNSNNYSNEKKYTCELTNLPKVEFEDTLSTNKGYVSLHYSNFVDDKKVEIEVNGEREEVLLHVEKEGNLEVEINQDFNEVAVIYHIDDEMVVCFEKEIYFNNEPPRIYMLNDYTDVHTNKATMDIIGSAQGAETVSVAGTPVELAADGSFSYTATLNEGENVFTIEAYDILGNGSVYTAKITYVPATGETQDTAITGDDEAEKNDVTDVTGEQSGLVQTLKKFLPGIIAFIIGLVLVIVVAVMPKKNKKSGILANLRKIVIYFLVLGAAVDGYFLVNWIKLRKSNSAIDYIDKAYDSIEEAGKLLAEEARWKQFFIYGAIEVGVCILLLVVLIVIGRIIRLYNAKKEKQ